MPLRSVRRWWERVRQLRDRLQPTLPAAWRRQLRAAAAGAPLADDNSRSSLRDLPEAAMSILGPIAATEERYQQRLEER